MRICIVVSFTHCSSPFREGALHTLCGEFIVHIPDKEQDTVNQFHGLQKRKIHVLDAITDDFLAVFFDRCQIGK